MGSLHYLHSGFYYFTKYSLIAFEAFNPSDIAKRYCTICSNYITTQKLSNDVWYFYYFNVSFFILFSTKSVLFGNDLLYTSSLYYFKLWIWYAVGTPYACFLLLLILILYILQYFLYIPRIFVKYSILLYYLLLFLQFLLYLLAFHFHFFYILLLHLL